MTGETGAAGGPQTVITAVATLEKPPTGSNVNEIVDGPAAAEAEAWSLLADLCGQLGQATESQDADTHALAIYRNRELSVHGNR